jgi:hypothetical protein
MLRFDYSSALDSQIHVRVFSIRMLSEKIIELCADVII